MSARAAIGAAVAGAAVALLLAACGAPGAGVLTGLPRTPQMPFSDEGDPIRIAEVRQVVVAALSAEVDVYRRTDAAGGLSAARRVAEAAAFETPQLASRVAYGGTEQWFGTIREATFEPARWDGVAVRGDDAKVYVIGHDRFLTLDGGVYRDAAWQYQLLLHRVPGAAHGWLLVAEAAVGDDRTASIDPAGGALP